MRILYTMGRIVAISGAAGGLGPTVARAFFKAGESLAVAGRSVAKLDQLLDSLGAPPDRRLASAVDLGDPGAAQAWVQSVLAKFGRIDVVLHLVGGYKGGTSVADISLSDWRDLQEALVGTTINVVRAFAGTLKKRGGRFIGVTSPKAHAPTAKSALYAMAKAASDALVLALADELKGTGSTANLIVVDSIGSDPQKPYGKSTPPEEIAAAMLFLCSDNAATINGIRLPMMGKQG
jgi:NAD(P)-dependent dehydrogenase (short-subunit alcohol dehydrogenase family)